MRRGSLRRAGPAALDRPGLLPAPQPRQRGDAAGGGADRAVVRRRGRRRDRRIRRRAAGRRAERGLPAPGRLPRRGRLRVAMWVDELRAASFRISYELHDGPAEDDPVAVMAWTRMATFDLDAQRPRRLTTDERAFLGPVGGRCRDLAAPARPRGARRPRRVRRPGGAAGHDGGGAAARASGRDRHGVGADAVRRARHPDRARRAGARPTSRCRRSGCSPRWPSSGRRRSTPASGALWQGELPPDDGWSRVDDVPAAELDGLTERGLALARENAGPLGPPASLLDQTVLTVTAAAGPAVRVPLRCLFALSGMGFLGAEADADRCGSRPPAPGCGSTPATAPWCAAGSRRCPCSGLRASGRRVSGKPLS